MVVDMEMITGPTPLRARQDELLDLMTPTYRVSPLDNTKREQHRD